MTNGLGLMSEAGPEGILPAPARGRGGRLGVEVSGMGGGNAPVAIKNVIINQGQARC